MTCTKRAKRSRKLWNSLSSKEQQQPSNELELHEILHEIAAERYGDMGEGQADKILADIDDMEYELLWNEAIKRFRKRRRLDSGLAEVQIYT